MEETWGHLLGKPGVYYQENLEGHPGALKNPSHEEPILVVHYPMTLESQDIDMLGDLTQEFIQDTSLMHPVRRANRSGCLFPMVSLQVSPSLRIWHILSGKRLDIGFVS